MSELESIDNPVWRETAEAFWKRVSMFGKPGGEEASPDLIDAVAEQAYQCKFLSDEVINAVMPDNIVVRDWASLFRRINATRNGNAGKSTVSQGIISFWKQPWFWVIVLSSLVGVVCFAISCSESDFDLGLRYFKGEGVTKDLNEAIELWQRAAHKGDTKAMNSLAECYDKGEGVLQDEAKAAELRQRAADMGNAEAMLKLGKSYENG